MTTRQRFLHRFLQGFLQAKAAPSARKRGLATRIQWQPFAPFQPGLSASFDLFGGGTSSPRAFES
jgi:hypothetical protein